MADGASLIHPTALKYKFEPVAKAHATVLLKNTKQRSCLGQYSCPLVPDRFLKL